jgi:uncharacterized protein YfeS
LATRLDQLRRLLFNQSHQLTSDFAFLQNRLSLAAFGFDAGTDPLFTLMHSKNYIKKKSQFVIFVTPQIIENASEGTEDLKKNFRVKVK